MTILGMKQVPENVLQAADWYRVPDGRICRILAWTLGPEGVSFDLWTADGVKTASWRVGNPPELVPLDEPRVGEWWHFRSCAQHGSLNVIGELPFQIHQGWAFLGQKARELVSCGCLVPDESEFGRRAS